MLTGCRSLERAWQITFSGFDELVLIPIDEIANGKKAAAARTNAGIAMAW